MTSIKRTGARRLAAACVLVPALALSLAACDVPKNGKVWLSYATFSKGCDDLSNCPAMTDERFAAGYYQVIGAEDENGNASFDLEQWKQQFGYYQSTPVRAVYGNRLDLQLGRDMNCWQPPASARVACYVTNYGRAPFVDGRESEIWPGLKLGTDLAGDGDVHKSLATVAMVYDPNGIGRGGDRIAYYAFGPTDADGHQPLIRSIALDGEGPKTVPGMCRSCHAGGEHGGGSHVDNFLPFDVQSFYFSPGKTDAEGVVIEPSPYTLDDQQEAFRQLNALVMKTNPTPAIRNLLDGWYAGNVETPGATIPDDGYIAPGWDVDTVSRRVYQSVYRPYCRMCHVAQMGPLAFENVSDFDAEAVQSAVCGWRSMPNAQVPYGDLRTSAEGEKALLPQSRFGQSQGFWVDEVAKNDLWTYFEAHGFGRCS